MSKLNTVIISDYIKKIKEENKLSDMTIKTYKNIADNISFNIMATQPTIIKKLKALYNNPNTLQLYLNLIILVRKEHTESIDKLIKFRKSLKDEITIERKKNLTELDDTLPTYDKLNGDLDRLVGIMYIVNYLMVRLGFRNKDINLKNVKKIPSEKTENYIMVKPNKITLSINDYKTDKTNGEKIIEITDPRFISELKKLRLNDNEYMLGKKDGSKISNISTFNDKIIKYTIGHLGQTRIIKIVVKQLLKDNDFKRLEELSRTRGTSIAVLLKSYNLLNTTI
tara:strand:+ start:147 stop:992 length:846 start_codon:yes stop_codon:yes gene_type:complete